MVRGGWRRQNRDEGEFQFVYSNTDLENMIKTVSLRNFINAQYTSDTTYAAWKTQQLQRSICSQHQPRDITGTLGLKSRKFWEFLWTKGRSYMSAQHSQFRTLFNHLIDLYEKRPCF